MKRLKWCCRKNAEGATHMCHTYPDTCIIMFSHSFHYFPLSLSYALFWCSLWSITILVLVKAISNTHKRERFARNFRYWPGQPEFPRQQSIFPTFPGFSVKAAKSYCIKKQHKYLPQWSVSLRVLESFGKKTFWNDFRDSNKSSILIRSTKSVSLQSTR